MIMTKQMDVIVDIELARSKLRAIGLNTKKMPDEEIFNQAVAMNYYFGFRCYAVPQMPDMREKVKEYIKELDKEIKKYHLALEQTPESEPVARTSMITRIQTLTDVKNDLESRLEELI